MCCSVVPPVPAAVAEKIEKEYGAFPYDEELGWTGADGLQEAIAAGGRVCAAVHVDGGVGYGCECLPWSMCPVCGCAGTELTSCLVCVLDDPYEFGGHSVV